MSAEDIYILGVSMTRFGRYPDQDVIDLGFAAATGALADAGVGIRDVGVVGSGCLLQASSGLGQQLMKQLGQTGAPVYNVSNACATGATAVRVVMNALAAGEADIGLAVGMEKMGKTGLLGLGAYTGPPEHWTPAGRTGALVPTEGVLGTDLMPALFSHAANDYLRRFPDTPPEAFAEVAVKNHANSVLNPLAMYRREYSLDEVMTAEMVTSPNTVLMCGPTGDGAAAVVLVTHRALERMGAAARSRAVRVRASVLTSDPWAEGEEESPDLNTLTALAASRAYETSGVGPDELDLVELHDCFATAELLHYENLQLCAPGNAVDLLRSGATKRGGRTPVNISGGLLSKSHPLGATGIANIFEVATHLRGEAGERQVDGARLGMTHVVGLGSSCVVHILEAPSDR